MSTISLSKRTERPGRTITITITVDARTPVAKQANLLEAANAALDSLDAQAPSGPPVNAIHYSS